MGEDQVGIKEMKSEPGIIMINYNVTDSIWLYANHSCISCIPK